MRNRSVVSWLLALLFLPALASADVDLARLLERGRGHAGRAVAPHALLDGFDDERPGLLRLLVHAADARQAPAEAVFLGGDRYAVTVNPERAAELAAADPRLRLLWSAPRRPLLEQALGHLRVDGLRTALALTGKGVVVGIVDTGVDVAHGDLRASDGKSRIAWLLDLSRPPLGRHKAIENDYGCGKQDAQCAVYSGADLDDLIGNSTPGDEPRDTFGHGTHVASLAAGNGLASTPARYVGVAPEATLVVVRAMRGASGGTSDPDILLATRFVFERADELGMPAVVNLSLGGDFGAHDGTSELERGLAELVGPTHPGRAIVVAAGNSGELYGGLPYPTPLGIHSVVQVPPDTKVRVPLIIGGSSLPSDPSKIYTWIGTRPGDYLSIGVEFADGGSLLSPAAPGEDASDEVNGILATLSNGVTESDKPETVNHGDAALLLKGLFEQSTVLALTLEGAGTASIWVQPSGGIDPSSGSLGVLLPAATREGTLGIPASGTGLISVGASMNRSAWTDYRGRSQLATLGGADQVRAGQVASFSGAGPTALEQLKPDILAPGGFVIGAMSHLVDPRRLVGEGGMFDTTSECKSAEKSCLIVDDTHAVSTGTSMASPLAAGVIALLLERVPRANQDQLRLALRAGASRVSPHGPSIAQEGAGQLDAQAALSILEGREVAQGAASSAQSWMSLSSGLAHPDPAWLVRGLLHLRDAQGRVIDVPAQTLSFSVEPGRIVESPKREAPGLWSFAVTAGEATGGGQLTIEARVNGRPLTSQQLAIGVDPGVARGQPIAGEGCSLARSPLTRAPRSRSLLGLLAVVLLPVVRRRRRAA